MVGREYDDIAHITQVKQPQLLHPFIQGMQKQRAHQGAERTTERKPALDVVERSPALSHRRDNGNRAPTANVLYFPNRAVTP